MVRVVFREQASANRFASEVRRLYGAERWRDLVVRPDRSVDVPGDRPRLDELVARFAGEIRVAEAPPGRP